MQHLPVPTAKYSVESEAQTPYTLHVLTRVMTHAAVKRLTVRFMVINIVSQNSHRISTIPGNSPTSLALLNTV